VYQVTLDPAKADAIFADNIGKSLEIHWNSCIRHRPRRPCLWMIYPKRSGKRKESRAGKGAGQTGCRLEGDPVNLQPGARHVFLIDRYSRAAIWSIYHPAKNSSAGEVNKAAEKIAETLAKQVKGQ